MNRLEKKITATKFSANWYHHFHRLKAYLIQNKTTPGFKSVGLEEDLINWISTQSRTKDQLPADLRKKLAGLDFDFAEKGNIWELRYGQLAEFAKTHGHIHLPASEEKYEPLKDWLRRQIQGKVYLSENQAQKLDALGIDWQLVFTRDQQWEHNYFKLKEFYRVEGHCQVPQNWQMDKTLANWVTVQRRQQATNKLRSDRAQKLNDLGFIWHIQALYDAQWQIHYRALQSFYQENGHLRVPGKQHQLTSWIENQRVAKKNKKLLPERELQLNKLGFIWSFKELEQTEWDKNYQDLSTFKQEHGHCFVPIKYKENKILGTWVASQRKLEAENRLAKGKKQRLDQLGFIWRGNITSHLQSSYDAQWNLNFERLKIYQQVYGTCQVSLKINPVLQRWTRWQRILFYEGKLSRERLAKLNEIRFPWNVQESYWIKMYEALTDFKNQFGHTQVPYQWAPKPQLSAWVYLMKKSKSKLPASKIKLLDMIVFDWNRQVRTVVSWDFMYDQLLKFKEDYGHTRVPVRWPQNPKLGKWVSRMRQEKDKLYPERFALLNNIAFDWGYQLV